MMTGKNNFDQRGGELMPRELMERAADPALVPDEALVAILLKTGVHGLNVIELSRRLIEVFKTVLTPGDDKENLYALLLNNKNRPICEPLRISRGTADSAPAFARDVFKEALKWGAAWFRRMGLPVPCDEEMTVNHRHSVSSHNPDNDVR